MTAPLPGVERIVALYREAHEEHGDSERAVLWPKGRQEERFEALTRHLPGAGGFSVLDFGCGLAHLRPYLDARFPDVAYCGADAVPSFVAAASAKHPDASIVHATTAQDVGGTYDHVVASGTFNLRYVADAAANEALVQEELRALFARANVSMAVNFMTDHVDFQQDGAYHQDPASLLRFARDELSRRLLLDQSYLPYEFTLVVWKSSSIRAGESVYG